MKIVIATYTDDSGNGKQKAFYDVDFKIAKMFAKMWLKQQFDDDFSDNADSISFREWCEYGAWTGRIKTFEI